MYNSMTTIEIRAPGVEPVHTLMSGAGENDKKQQSSDDQTSWFEKEKLKTYAFGLIFAFLLAFSYINLIETLRMEKSLQKDTTSLQFHTSIGVMGFDNTQNLWNASNAHCMDDSEDCGPFAAQKATAQCSTSNLKELGKCVYEKVPNIFTMIDDEPHLGVTSLNRNTQLHSLLFAVISFSSAVVLGNLLSVRAMTSTRLKWSKSSPSLVYFIAVALVIIPFLVDITTDHTVTYKLKKTENQVLEVRDWITKPIMTDFFSLIYIIFYVLVIFAYDYSHKSVSKFTKWNFATFFAHEENSLHIVSDVTLAVILQLLFWISLTDNHKVVTEVDVQITLVISTIIGFGFVILNDVVHTVLHNHHGQDQEAVHNAKQMFMYFLWIFTMTFFIAIFTTWWMDVYAGRTDTLASVLVVALFILSIIGSLFNIMNYSYKQNAISSLILNSAQLGKFLAIAIVLIWSLFNNFSLTRNNDIAKQIYDDLNVGTCNNLKRDTELKASETRCGTRLRVEGWLKHQHKSADYLFDSTLTKDVRCQTNLRPSWECEKAS